MSKDYKEQRYMNNCYKQPNRSHYTVKVPASCIYTVRGVTAKRGSNEAPSPSIPLAFGFRFTVGLRVLCFKSTFLWFLCAPMLSD